MTRIRTYLRRVLLVAMIAAFGASAANAESSRYTILLKNNSVPKNFAAAVESAGGQLVRTIDSVGIAVAISDDVEFENLMAADSRVHLVGPSVYHAAPEMVAERTMEEDGPTADDVYLNIGWLWGIERVNAPAAWASGATGSHDTVVAVIDSGVAWNHPDLGPNVIFAACVTFAPGCNPYPTVSDHGTHVAGTVAAAFGGGRAVGVAPNVAIASYNVFENIPGCGHCAYTDSRWIAMLDATSRGFDVITMSLGGYGVYGGGRSSGLATYVAAEQRVAQAIEQAGTAVIASAGNGGADLNGRLIHVPGDVESITNVGATGVQPAPRYPYPGSFDIRAFYSNYGAPITLSAPGGDCGQIDTCNADRPADWFQYLILSTIVFSNPAHPLYVPDCEQSGTCLVGYGWKGGTSMATPHVAGVAALIIDQNPGISPKKVRAILKRTAQQVGSRQDFGHGIVDAAAATE